MVKLLLSEAKPSGARISGNRHLAGSSSHEGAPAGWLSAEDFQAELGHLGCAASPRQIERWHSEGLLLPRPIQVPSFRDGLVSGSTVLRAPTAPRQVLAIERALSVKNRIDDAGAILWLAGFEVDERYWRPRLDKKDEWFRGIVRRVVRQVRSQNESAVDTLGDRVAALDRFTWILDKVSRRLDSDQFAAMTNVLLSVATNEFDGFEPIDSERDELSTGQIVALGMDFAGAEKDEINGQRLTPGVALGPVFSDIAASLASLRLADLSEAELLAARDDIRNGWKIAACMYEALAWIYGPQAFGLRLANWLGRTARIDFLFVLIGIFARMRRRSNAFYSSEQISCLAHQAQTAWLEAIYFRDHDLAHPELRKLFGAARFKKAFSDSREHEKMREDLKRYPFPEPDFRPWDSWRKMSKRTMSPGLLAMSIGSPSKVALADILPSVNADATP